MLEEYERKAPSFSKSWKKWFGRFTKKKNKGATASEDQMAFLGLAHYVRLHKGGDWVLAPRWKVAAPALALFSLGLYAAIASGKYWLDRYYYECKETPYWEMYLYVVPNRIPLTNFVVLPEFLNRHIMDVRHRQQQRMKKMVAKSPQNIADLWWLMQTSPENIDMQLQGVYLLASQEWLNRPLDAMKVLDNTLPYIFKEKATTDKNLSRYAWFCFQYEQDDRIIQVAEKYLPDPDIAPSTRTLLANFLAEALYLKGELSRASEIINRYDLLHGTQGILLKVKILWENGERQRAIEILKHHAGPKGDGREQFLYALVKFYWELDQREEAIQTLDRISSDNPEDYKPRIRPLYLLDDKNDPGKKRREKIIKESLERHGTSEPAMLELGNYATERGDIELQRKIEALSLANRFSKLSSFHFLVIETLVTAGKNREALDSIKNIFLQKPLWLQKSTILQTQFETLRMVAYFSNGQVELGRVTLSQLTEKNIPATVAVASARRLFAQGYPNEAKQLLSQSYSNNPRNSALLLELVKLDTKSENTTALDEHLGRLLNGRRPPRQVLQKAYEHLGSDRFLFSPNRSHLLGRLDHMLRTRVLPTNEIEKSWPGATPELGTPITPDLPFSKS
ncbi:MAG: tetratricopeptide repeat protein [Puniceicoccales bacterium]|jgi:hypothetical protein|nr:tetratricopeptide repeat protein [Puniceicoccales bacterium]